MTQTQFTPEQERVELDTLTDREMVAYWNVLTMSAKCIGGSGDKNARHADMLRDLLSARGIPFEDGKLIKRVAA